MLLVVGVVGVLTSARTTGIDTVVDTAMIDGANHLYSMMHGFSAMGMWRHDARGRNLLDSGTPFYDVYPTADDRYVSVACIEPAVFADFLGTLGIEDQLPEPLSEIDHWQPRHWSIMRRVFAEALASRTLAELEELFTGHDACVEPVRTMAEAKTDPHNLHRGLFCTDEAGIDQPTPAPRFGQATAPTSADGAPTSAGTDSADQPRRAPAIGSDTDAVIAELGL